MTFIHLTHTHTLLSAHRESLQLANRLANTHYALATVPAKPTRYHAVPPPQSPLLILKYTWNQPTAPPPRKFLERGIPSVQKCILPSRRRQQSGTTASAIESDSSFARQASRGVAALSSHALTPHHYLLCPTTLGHMDSGITRS